MIGFTSIYVCIKTHSPNYYFVLRLSSTLVKKNPNADYSKSGFNMA